MSFFSQRYETTFYRKWDGHEADYLSSDFGNARYVLVQSTHLTLPDQRPAIAFVGAGKHNGGEKGSVIVVVSQREGYIVNSYLLRDSLLSNNLKLTDSEDFKALVKLATSVHEVSK